MDPFHNSTLHNTVLRSMSGPCYPWDSVPMIKQDMSRLQAPAVTATAKKAGTFGLLSVCANRRMPSRASRRSSICGADSAHDPWFLNPRRSSQARMEHISRSRARSVRVPTASSAVPSNDLHSDGHPKLSPSASVPQNSATPLCALAPSPALPRPCPFPVVSTLDRPSPSESRRPSLMARTRRVPSSSRYPPIDINASAHQYTFDIALPIAIKPEMVTITTARGDKLRIVADAWHLEADCHFEWEIAFRPHDVDISAIRAKFDAQGRLTINAGRLVCTP